MSRKLDHQNDSRITVGFAWPFFLIHLQANINAGFPSNERGQVYLHLSSNFRYCCLLAFSHTTSILTYDHVKYAVCQLSYSQGTLFDMLVFVWYADITAVYNRAFSAVFSLSVRTGYEFCFESSWSFSWPHWLKQSTRAVEGNHFGPKNKIWCVSQSFCQIQRFSEKEKNI